MVRHVYCIWECFHYMQKRMKELYRIIFLAFLILGMGYDLWTRGEFEPLLTSTRQLLARW